MDRERLKQLYLTEVPMRKISEELGVEINELYKEIWKLKELGELPRDVQRRSVNKCYVWQECEPDGIVVNCTCKVAKQCVYGNAQATTGEPKCNYISITGHMRGCDPDKCDKFAKVSRERKRFNVKGENFNERYVINSTR